MALSWPCKEHNGAETIFQCSCVSSEGGVMESFFGLGEGAAWRGVGAYFLG